MQRILLVAGETTPPHVVRRALERWGYAVDQTGHSAEAVRLFEREPVDLVIVDLGLPARAGIESIARIRDVDDDVPIISLGGPDDIAATEALAVGASLPLDKPFAPDELWVAIGWLLGRRPR